MNEKCGSKIVTLHTSYIRISSVILIFPTIQFNAVLCVCNQTKTDKVPRDVRCAKFGKITTRLSNRLVSRSRTYVSTNWNEPGIRQTNFMQDADLKLNIAQLVWRRDDDLDVAGSSPLCTTFFLPTRLVCLNTS